MNGDGFWGPANGAVDVDTLVWCPTRVLWVGDFDRDASILDIDCDIIRGCARANALTEWCADAPVDLYLTADGELDLFFKPTDQNGNCLNGGGVGRTYIELDSV